MALYFLKQYTIEQFKELKHVDKIKVRRNPHTGKLFMTFGSETGSCKQEGPITHPMISWVKNEKDEEFWLLHEEGTGGAPILQEF